MTINITSEPFVIGSQDLDGDRIADRITFTAQESQTENGISAIKFTAVTELSTEGYVTKHSQETFRPFSPSFPSMLRWGDLKGNSFADLRVGLVADRSDPRHHVVSDPVATLVSKTGLSANNRDIQKQVQDTKNEVEKIGLVGAFIEEEKLGKFN